MAATKKKTSETPASIQVKYNLLDLPTAQHKAGLAGLVLQVEAMRERKRPAKSIPDVKITGVGTVEAVFTEESLCGVFNELYDATIERVTSPSKWPGATSVDEKEDVDPKTQKPRRLFVYEVVQPKGWFLRKYTDDGKEAWHKLWRDMLWAIPRGKPTTRGPFNSRSEQKSCGEGEAVWKDLIVLEKGKAKGGLRTTEVAGAILLGAQALSAESVPFRDRVDHVLLLHFWQLTARIFVPEVVDADGKREFVGYVLAIPEVADVDKFCKRYTRLLGRLSKEMNGYRPRDSVISLPAEGALEFMEHLQDVVGAENAGGRNELAASLSGVEFFQMVKLGNNIKTATGGRLPPSDRLLRGHEAIKASSRNPMFRGARVQALLREKAWHEEFAQMFAERDWPLFVTSADTPRMVPSFAWDAAVRFKEIEKNEQKRKVKEMEKNEPRKPASLETLVYRLVRQYVRAKTEQKSGISYSSFKDKTVKDAKGRERVAYPEAYTDAQERVTSDLFLGIRSRRDDDFVSFFTGTIGSVAQGGNLSEESDFAVIASALLDDEKRKHVKTLAMLATSAASYATSNTTEEQNEKETE